MDNSTPNNAELLVRYLDDELSSVEKEELEKRLAADASLRSELESLQISREAIRQYGLRDQVRKIHGPMMKELSEPVKQINSARRILRYSISVAAGLLLVVGGFMAYNFFTLSPDKILASRYQPYELSTTRDNTQSETDIEKAYRGKDYREVTRIYSKGEDSSIKSTFLGGMAFLELKDPSRAIAGFKAILDNNKRSGTTLFNDEAEYYLALSYIRNRDYDLAISLMEKIRENPNHLYHEKITGRMIRQVKLLKWR